MTVRVAIALGSNLGNRADHLRYATARLSMLLDRFSFSRFFETEPQDVSPQPLFLNAAAAGETQATAREVLDQLLAIERERGRERPHPGAPRTLDLDLILHGASVIDEPGLSVPHPRFRSRRFVLEPLSLVAGDMIDPVTGLSVKELLKRLG